MQIRIEEEEGQGYLLGEAGEGAQDRGLVGLQEENRGGRGDGQCVQITDTNGEMQVTRSQFLLRSIQ